MSHVMFLPHLLSALCMIPSQSRPAVQQPQLAGETSGIGQQWYLTWKQGSEEIGSTSFVNLKEESFWRNHWPKQASMPAGSLYCAQMNDIHNEECK